MVKLIMTDIDGTLIPDGTMDINPEYFEVIGKLVEKLYSLLHQADI